MPETGEQVKGSAAQENTQGAAEQTKDRKDILNTPQPEAEEMDQLINKGLTAHNTISFLTVLSILVIGLGVLYFKFDKFAPGQSYADKLQVMIDTQSDKDFRAYRFGDDVYRPNWPLNLYKKIRSEIFLVSLLVLVICAVFIYIEKAKMRRNDILVYRAMAREVEKLRLRIKKLEGGEKKDE
ncbi:MAG: hypothetical protein JXR97_11835 [Planctomycetes bacterium]|nr:hypothetical protein [Planctomycetota bacterium]